MLVLREMHAAEDTRDTEVHHLDHTKVIQHHVGAFDVSVHDAVFVRVLDAIESLEVQGKGALEAHRTERVHQVFEGLTLDVFHHHHEQVALAHEAVEGGDIRVVEAREHQRFGSESLDHAVACHELCAQHLEGDRPAKGEIGRLPHEAHATLTELLVDPVVADGLADQR